MRQSSESVEGGLSVREVVLKRIKVIKFGVNDGGGSSADCCAIEVRACTVKLTNVIIAGFRKD